jgi:hypothetical protein
MTKVEQVQPIRLIVKAQFDRKRLKAGPLGQGVVKDWFVLIDSEIRLTDRHIRYTRNIAVGTERSIASKVHGSRTARICCAIRCAFRSRRLQFRLVHVPAVGKVGKAHGMIVIGNVGLIKGIGLSDFQANGRARSIAAFFKVKVA